MKYLIILCLTLPGGLPAWSQLPDFPLHSNGLLYSDTLMSRLRHLADSMRSRSGVARAEGDYYSPKQTTGRLVRLDTGDIYGAYKDLAKGISLEELVRKYPQAEVDDKIVVMLDERPGYQAAGNAYYYNLMANDPYASAGRIILSTDEYYKPIANRPLNYRAGENSGINGNCVFVESTEPHTHRGKFSTEAYVYAFYLDGVPTAVRLPKTAMRLIRHRDRMLDTAIGVYYKNAQYASLDFRNVDFGPAQKAFDDYIERRGTPVAAVDTGFQRLLAAAVTEVEEKNYYPFIYLERYMDSYSPRAALEIRRRWRPVMMDNFGELIPRLYNMHIAWLAAGLGNWPVFLHAQLAVAIDPYGEYPDPSRPGHRSVFLRELEELNIGVDDILLGNVLANTWPDPGFSGVNLLGKALALEGGDRRRLEEKVLKLIADKGLDDYHRLAMHYLFLNYIGFLPAGPARIKASSRLERADRTLPEYLSARVKGDKNVQKNISPKEI